MIRSLATHAAFILHAVVFTTAIALAVMGAENRPNHNSSKQLSFPAFSQRPLFQRRVSQRRPSQPSLPSSAPNP